jgi:hypothetical protein
MTKKLLISMILFLLFYNTISTQETLPPAHVDITWSIPSPIHYRIEILEIRGQNISPPEYRFSDINSYSLELNRESVYRIRVQTVNQYGVLSIFSEPSWLVTKPDGSYELIDPSLNPVVFITKTGKTYHLETCRYLSTSKIPILLEVAKSKGYTSCSACDPDSNLNVGQIDGN